MNLIIYDVLINTWFFTRYLTDIYSVRNAQAKDIVNLIISDVLINIGTYFLSKFFGFICLILYSKSDFLTVVWLSGFVSFPPCAMDLLAKLTFFFLKLF